MREQYRLIGLRFGSFALVVFSYRVFYTPTRECGSEKIVDTVIRCLFTLWQQETYLEWQHINQISNISVLSCLWRPYFLYFRSLSEKQAITNRT